MNAPRPRSEHPMNEHLASTLSERPDLTARNQPATELPWKWGWNGDTCAVWGAAIVLSGGELTAHGVKRGKETNAAYIVHAANAYPRLVAALREASEQLKYAQRWAPTRATDGVIGLMCNDYADLLRELGELE